MIKDRVMPLIYRFINGLLPGSRWSVEGARKNERLNDDPYIVADAWRLISGLARCSSLREINGARMRFLLVSLANFGNNQISNLSPRGIFRRKVADNFYGIEHVEMSRK